MSRPRRRPRPASTPRRQVKEVDANPEKTFFTRMLTRDIELKDAILDLLDNCYDGIVRSGTTPKPTESKPFKQYWARITCDEIHFQIEDNCGGIPRDIALHYAFKFGRSDRRQESRDVAGTVGVYGIGMKRAIFKMGTHATVVSQYLEKKSLTVEVPENWASEARWFFPYEDTGRVLAEKGTRIRVDQLHPSISQAFSDRKGFLTDLDEAISHYYGLILNRGFVVELNGVAVVGSEFRLLVPSDLLQSGPNAHERLGLKNQILPYKYRGTIQGVSVDIVCGFYAPLQVGESDDSDELVRASSAKAGWTISCNDRVVVYNDKTRLTGWGEALIPMYHAQFRTFSGLVQFRSNDAKLLPMNTTKRGIDANSALYSEVRDLMRSGLRQFVTFTNKWKSDKRVAQFFRGTVPATLPQIERANLPMRRIRLKTGQEAFNPDLPSPPDENPAVRISFYKPIRQIRRVARALSLDEDSDPSVVGETAFDEVRRGHSE